MKKRILCTAALLAAATAHAEPRVGVSLGETLAGTRGLGGRVDLGAVQLEALIGGVLRDTDSFVGPREGSLRAFVPLERWQDGWIGVMAGADGASMPDAVGGGHAWAIEAGVHAEWLVLPSLSLGLDLGGAHGYRDPLGGPFNPTEAFQSTVLGIGVAGGGTLTFWF